LADPVPDPHPGPVDPEQDQDQDPDPDPYQFQTNVKINSINFTFAPENFNLLSKIFKIFTPMTMTRNINQCKLALL
jgi:hypothetical protein